MTHSLNLDGLRAFVAVVETMNFSKAADVVGRTQSGVSLQLARLERQIGKALIRRRQGRVDGLTDEGRILLPYARRMVELNESAWRAVAVPTMAGRVRLGVPADFLQMDFPDLLKRFQLTHPGVELEVMSDVSDALRDRLRQGGLDVAFFKRPAGEGESGTIARQQVVWCGNRAAAPDADRPLPLVLFPNACAYRRLALAALEQAGMAWRVVFASPSAEGVRAALLAGLGVGAMPSEAVTGDLVAIQNAGLPPLGEVELAVAFAPTAGEPARFLADHLRDRLIRRAGS